MGNQSPRAPCARCDKSQSRAQAIGWAGRHFCIDCILHLFSDNVDDDERVDISIDYLKRLRDGVV